MIKTLITLLITNNIVIGDLNTNSLNLDLVVYQITSYLVQPYLSVNLSGAGSGSIVLRICDSTYGCRLDMPSTIHQEITQNFLLPGSYQIPILNFTKNNEFKKVNLIYTSNTGVTKNLNFSIMSAFPKSYNIFSTTLAKVIRESSYITVTAENVSTTFFNSLDFRGFYLKPTQDRVINFKDYKIQNNGVYIPINGFVQLLHGFEDSEFSKNGSYYQFSLKSTNIAQTIVPTLDGYFYNKDLMKMTNTSSQNSIPTTNLIVSKNYDRSKANTMIFNFANVGSHGSNIRVTTNLNIRNQIFGNCNSSMICVAKAPIKVVAYSRVKVSS